MNSVIASSSVSVEVFSPYAPESLIEEFVNSLKEIEYHFPTSGAFVLSVV